MRTRSELENLINGSPLFQVDRTLDAELFVTEERKFLSDLAALMSIIRKDFAEVGLEIMETAQACIKAHKAENGAFLNYFNTALSRKIRTTKAKEMASNVRGGMRVDKKTEQTIRQILKLAKARGKDIYDKDFQKHIAAELGYPLSAIRDAILTNDGMAALSGNTAIAGKDGSETELFDLIAAAADPAEDKVIKLESAREFAVLIDEAFKVQQERTKPLLNYLLTVKLIGALDNIALIAEVVQGLSFFNENIFLDYKNTGIVPTAKENAWAHGVSEQSASRTLKTFIEKVKEKR